MSIDHISKVLNLGTEVNGTTRMVLFVLAEAANQDSDECWPSTATIRKRAGLKQDRYVTKAVAELAETGMVEVDPNGCPDERIPANRRPNLYRMVGVMALVSGGARRAGSEPSGGARRADQGVRDALFAPHIEPEEEPEAKSSANAETSSKGVRLPEPFALTDAMREWAAKNVPRVDIRDQTERFCDYWRGVPGAKGTKTDWLGTWRNWMKRSNDDITERQQRANGKNPMDLKSPISKEDATPWK